MNRDTAKTPQWKIDAIRLMVSDGVSLRTVATQLDVSKQTVGRYSAGIKRPKPRPLTTRQRGYLLKHWMPVKRLAHTEDYD